MNKLVILIVIVLASCGGEHRQLEVIPATRSASLPSIEYALLAGGTWSSQAAAGRIIVLDIWATYCKPCRKAFPKLNRLAAAFPDLVVIGLSVDDEDHAVTRFLGEVPATFPIARDPKQIIQSGPLAIRELPTVLVVDRVGRIRFRAEKLVESDYDKLFDIVAALRTE